MLPKVPSHYQGKSMTISFQWGVMKVTVLIFKPNRDTCRVINITLLIYINGGQVISTKNLAICQRGLPPKYGPHPKV